MAISDELKEALDLNAAALKRRKPTDADEEKVLELEPGHSLSAKDKSGSLDEELAEVRALNERPERRAAAERIIARGRPQEWEHER